MTITKYMNKKANEWKNKWMNMLKELDQEQER